MDILGELSLEFCWPHPDYLVAKLWTNPTIGDTVVNLEIKMGKGKYVGLVYFCIPRAQGWKCPEGSNNCHKTHALDCVEKAELCLMGTAEVVSKSGSWGNPMQQELIVGSRTKK